MCLGIFFLWGIILPNIKFVHSSQSVELQKVLLISATYFPLDWLNHSESKASPFRTFLQEGCLISNISIHNLFSSAEINSVFLSGGLHPNSNSNTSDRSVCDRLFFSKFSPYFEPLWLTNQRHGMRSASFFWPDDYIPVNKSRPFTVASSNPSGISNFFEMEQIYHWLTNPSVSLMSIFIHPPQPRKKTNFFFNYARYTDTFLSSLISYIKNSSKLNASVSVVFIGGTGAIDALSNDEVLSVKQHFDKLPVSAFSNRFNLGRVLELWLTPDAEDESLLDKQKSPYFITCSTAEFRKQHIDLDTGLLPPYYLVAKPKTMLQVSSMGEPTDTQQLSPFALLWGSAFVNSPEVCGAGSSSSTGQAGERSTEVIQISDIYPLVCWILGLSRPWLHWGHLARVSRFLRKPPSSLQIEEFEKQSRVWSTSKDHGVLFGFSNKTLLFSGIVCIFVLAFGIVFVVCAIKVSRRYSRMLGPSAGDTRRRLISRSRPASSNPQFTSQRQRLLDSANGDQGNEEGTEEEDYVVNVRSFHRANTNAFIEMLHYPSERGSPRTVPVLSHS